jgi:hypothetical protein
MITDDFGSYTDKYEKRFDAENINNYVINCNYSCIKGINGRRYVVLDLNPIYRDNFEFFKTFRQRCFNDEVGKAFYCYLCEIDVKDFNSSAIPETMNKKDAIIDLLTPMEKFLKTFVLKKNGIKMKVKELHGMYLSAFDSKASVQKFCGQMRDLGFEYSKLNGYSVYKIPYDELKKLADQKKWLHELDGQEGDVEDDDESECMFKVDRAETIRSEEYKHVIDSFQLQLDNLKEKLEYELEDKSSFEKYIRELEKRVYQLEDENERLKEGSEDKDELIEKKPKKKLSNPKVKRGDPIQIADNIVILPDGSELEVLDELEIHFD